MLPTPNTTHINPNRIYIPAEDSYLLLDTLSSPTETDFLSLRFTSSHLSRIRCPTPLVVEVGTGSGIVLAFLHANATTIFARSDILTLGIDINEHACHATSKTIEVAAREKKDQHQDHGFYGGNLLGNLASGIRNGEVDMLVFNPPYVPTDDPLPQPPADQKCSGLEGAERGAGPSFEEDSDFLKLSYAGGKDGMEVTDRLLDSLPSMLSPRGVAYVLLCAQNKPKEVIERLRAWGLQWEIDNVGSSGKQAGWEKLVIVRIARAV